MPRRRAHWAKLPRNVLEEVLHKLQKGNKESVLFRARTVRDIETAVTLQRVCKGWRCAYGFANTHLWQRILNTRCKSLRRARALTLNHKAMRVYARHALEQERTQAWGMQALFLWCAHTHETDLEAPPCTRDAALQHSLLDRMDSLYDAAWQQHCDKLGEHPHTCLQGWRPLFVRSTAIHVHLYCVPVDWAHFVEPSRFAFECKELEAWCRALYDEEEISALSRAPQTPRNVREWLSVWTEEAPALQAPAHVPIIAEREVSLYRISWCRGASWVPRLLHLDTYGLQRALQPLSRPRVEPQKLLFELTFLLYRHHGLAPRIGLYLLGLFYYRMRSRAHPLEVAEAMRTFVSHWIRENRDSAQPQLITVSFFRAILARSQCHFQVPLSILEEEAIMYRSETQFAM